jgi:hypothetical protein
LRAHQTEFERRGANLAAIGLGDFVFARAFIEQTGITFPLLVDEERKTYEAMDLKQANLFHLFRKDNMERRKEAKEAGFRQEGIKKNPFQLGGAFVFGPGNVDRFAHVAETFSDNANVADLLAALP